MAGTDRTRQVFSSWFLKRTDDDILEMKRLFRGLRGDPPKDSYDAVIIGAGIGGLICANLLARAGLRVLLTEQHYMVGGYCSTFRRAGYTFDAATHFYPLLGNSATITGK